MDETKSKESVDGLKDPKRLSDLILPHILKLYASSATARDFEIYARNATFEDPVMCAHGVKQIKSAFYSLSKHYKLMGKDVDVVSLIKLRVEEGKVVRHEDWWGKKPLRNRETV
ncbi:hypothetical protein ACLOJK_003498 [Asimina triloba]